MVHMIGHLYRHTDSKSLVCIFLLDVDECEVGGYACPGDQICKNTLGSYTCNCAPGYVMDSKRCVGTFFIYSRICSGKIQRLYAYLYLDAVVMSRFLKLSIYDNLITCFRMTK